MKDWIQTNRTPCCWSQLYEKKTEFYKGNCRRIVLESAVLSVKMVANWLGPAWWFSIPVHFCPPRPPQMECLTGFWASCKCHWYTKWWHSVIAVSLQPNIFTLLKFIQRQSSWLLEKSKGNSQSTKVALLFCIQFRPQFKAVIINVREWTSSLFVFFLKVQDIYIR